MNNSLKTMILCCFVLVGCGSDEASVQLHGSEHLDPRVISAQLTQLELDRSIPAQKNWGGYVTLSQAARSVSVSIVTCPPNALCSQFEPVYSAAILKEEILSCGVRVTTAKSDRRSTDGALIEIKVTDYSKTVCDYAYPFLTEVELKTEIQSRMTAEVIRTKSYLRGQSGLK